MNSKTSTLGKSANPLDHSLKKSNPRMSPSKSSTASHRPPSKLSRSNGMNELKTAVETKMAKKRLKELRTTQQKKKFTRESRKSLEEINKRREEIMQELEKQQAKKKLSTILENPIISPSTPLPSTPSQKNTEIKILKEENSKLNRIIKIQRRQIDRLQNNLQTIQTKIKTHQNRGGGHRKKNKKNNRTKKKSR